jgi:hypothetical protein
MIPNRRLNCGWDTVWIQLCVRSKCEKYNVGLYTLRKIYKKLFKAGLKRINKYTPAVTKVEEWTEAETGVGAAIAAGNQEENGIWALLVIAAKITNNEIKFISKEPAKKPK